MAERGWGELVLDKHFVYNMSAGDRCPNEPVVRCSPNEYLKLNIRERTRAGIGQSYQMF